MGPPHAENPRLQPTLDALASPIRREILWMVWDTELPAGEIAAGFEVSGATISSHLNVLRNAGLVVVRADGNFRRYRTDRAAMSLIAPMIASGGDRWKPAEGVPGADGAEVSIGHWVQVAADAQGVGAEEAFEDFADGDRFTRWLGWPVSIEDGRFSAELEWGTKVRGHYEIVDPPRLIAMWWDFADDDVPVPGGQLTAYLRISERSGAAHVEVHQHAPTPDQADFMAVAWATVLGRWAQFHKRAEGT